MEMALLVTFWRVPDSEVSHGFSRATASCWASFLRYLARMCRGVSGSTSCQPTAPV